MNSVNNIVGAVCERSAWKLSNLSIQKAAFLCQLFYMGETNSPLFIEDFEAWDYGPVQPKLYHRLKMFGSDPVKPMSYLRDVRLPDERATRIVNEVAELAKNVSPGKLVEITHWKDGAWAKYYKTGSRGIVIPKSEIRAEYAARLVEQNAARDKEKNDS